MNDNKTSQRRPWTQPEDRALKILYEGLKLNRWSLIAQQLEQQYGFSGRTGKQCRERYNNQLDPGLTRQNWTFDQQKRLYRLHDELGNKWAIISQRLGPGRTDNSVKNHYFSRLRKALRKLNKLIQDKLKKQVREIQTKVLYKVIQASQEKFKAEPMCDSQTSERATILKNRILLFSYEEQELPQLTDEPTGRELIKQIVEFNRTYKRKPKKFRKLGAPNLDMLDNIDPEHQPHSTSDLHQHLGAGFLTASRSNFQEDEEDEINPSVHKIETQKQKMIIPIILTSQPRIAEEKVEEKVPQNGPQLLEELGLLEDVRDHVPFLRRQQTSQMSNNGQESHEEFKFFQDSENEMRLFSGSLLHAFKKESIQDRLFH